jgi:hypothetical protein
MKYKEVEGDLISFALSGSFDVVAQGNNCFCVQGAGLAPQFVKTFNTDHYSLEDNMFRGDINKLGQIDYMWVDPKTKDHSYNKSGLHTLAVVNCYTQYGFGRNHEGGTEIPLDYHALALCLKKLNHEFKGMKIGLPYVIGCGLAGGNKMIVIEMIKDLLKDCYVTMVKLP